MVGPHLPLLASSSGIGVHMLTPFNVGDFSGHNASPAENCARQKPLVVVGGPVDVVEPYDGIQFEEPSAQQLPPADEEPATSRIRSLRRSV